MAVRLSGRRRGRRTLAVALLCLGLAAPRAETCAADDVPPSAVEDLGEPNTSAIPKVAEIPIWRSITLGTYQSVAGLREALDAARFHVGTLAGDILDGRAFAVSATEIAVDLVIVTSLDLDLGAENRSRAEIYERALQRGLRLCAPEVAPQLRLQYRDQPRGEFLHIAMEPVTVRDGERAAFIIGNGGAGLLLIAGEARGDLEIATTVRFVFVRPR
jgi:hypothetical protein